MSFTLFDPSQINGILKLTGGTLTGILNMGEVSISGASLTLSVPNVRFHFTTTTTVYYKSTASFSGVAPVIYGRISARRVR